MDDSGSKLTLKEEIAQETKRLCASGVPEFLASIQAAVNVSKRQAAQNSRREAAMLSHCNEP
jgi:predicted transcriptional regulator